MTKQSGFTLIELVTVMIVLALISVGISGFVRTGTQIYVDVTERDQLLSESRFVVQRLNREIKGALPNSLRVASNVANTTQCLEFLPVLWSSFYFDIPVAPEPADDEIKVVAIDNTVDPYTFVSGDSVVVYPTEPDDIYGSASKRFLLDSAPTVDPADSKKQILTLSNEQQFATDSPRSRAYIVRSPVSYCVSAGEIKRYTDYGFNTTQDVTLTSGVLMGENLANDLDGDAIDKPFRISESTLTRNAFALTLLRFELGDELAVFNSEVHVPNVP